MRVCNGSGLEMVPFAVLAGPPVLKIGSCIIRDFLGECPAWRIRRAGKVSFQLKIAFARMVEETELTLKVTATFSESTIYFLSYIRK